MTSRPRAKQLRPITAPQRLRRTETLSAGTAAVLTALYGPHSFADTAINPPASGGALDEVVVTATRRAVLAEDLPISITAVSGATLDQAGIVDVAELAHSMAGVNVTDKGPFSVNGSNLIIRGLNSEQTAGQLALATPVVPPVATYVDDTPLFFNLRLQALFGNRRNLVVLPPRFGDVPVGDHPPIGPGHESRTEHIHLHFGTGSVQRQDRISFAILQRIAILV